MTPRCWIENLTNQPLVLNFPHGAAPEHAAPSTVGSLRHNPKTGERKVTARRKMISASVHLRPKGLPGSVVEASRAVVHAPDVVAGVKARRIALHLEEPKAAHHTKHKLAIGVVHAPEPAAKPAPEAKKAEPKAPPKAGKAAKAEKAEG